MLHEIRPGRGAGGAWMLVPWGVYVLVTVVVPLADGAAGRDGFSEHAVIAVGVPGVATLFWAVSRHVSARIRNQRSRARGPLRG